MPVDVLKCSSHLLAELVLFPPLRVSNDFNVFILFFFLGGLENPGIFQLCCRPSSGSTWQWWPVGIGWRRRWSCSNQPCSLVTGRSNSTSSQKNLWSQNLISRWIFRNHSMLCIYRGQIGYSREHMSCLPMYLATYSAVRLNPCGLHL